MSTAVKMGRINYLSNGKSLMILGTVVGCLTLLWPKIFYPMIQGGLWRDNQDLNTKTKIHPRMKSPKPSSGDSYRQPNFYGPSSHYQQGESNSIGGASIGLLMTVYTAGIILLFLFTIFKYMTSDAQDSLCDENKTLGVSDRVNGDTDSCVSRKHRKATFNELDHEQGECLKHLALNYVRCKSKIPDQEKLSHLSEDDVSMAYRTLLGDMLELRDYLVDLEYKAFDSQFQSSKCYYNSFEETSDDNEDIYQSAYPSEDVQKLTTQTPDCDLQESTNDENQEMDLTRSNKGNDSDEISTEDKKDIQSIDEDDHNQSTNNSDNEE